VVLHKALEVEVGKLLIGLDVEKGRELGIGVDLSAVGLVLELMGADVVVDLLAHSGAGHLGTVGLAKEGGELGTDLGGLDKARGLAVASTLGALAGGLLGGLELARDHLLESLEITLDSSKDAVKLLELSTELVHLLVHRGIVGNRRGISSGGGSHGGGLNCRSRGSSLLGGLLLLGGGLLGGGSLLDRGGGCRCRGSRLLVLRRSNHF